MSDAEKLLAQLGAQVELAKAALADENEGDLRRAVTLIDSDAHKLMLLVLTW
jgi:hypothetical protein